MIRLTILASLLILAIPPPSHAATIYDSDPIPPPDFPTGVGICDGNLIADHFVLTTTATVQSISYTLLEQEAGSAVINWSFYTDANGLPGAVIASGSTVETRVITPPYDALFATTYFFYLNASFTVPATTLAAGSYWLGLSDPVDSPQQDGLTAASFWCGVPVTAVNFSAGENDGGAFVPDNPPLGLAMALSDTPLPLPSTTPEPSGIVMLVVGLGVVGGGRWRQERRNGELA